MNRHSDEHRQTELDFADSCHYVEQQQRYIPEPRQVNSLVNRIIAKRGLAASQSTEELQALWTEVVGVELCRRTRIGCIRRGALEVIVENSSILQQLKFKEHLLLPQLQARQPHFGITTLRLRVGSIH